ncbi:hypothetical protein QBC34DRAFT_440777 [Podospora aff. communis PSN243]|uniref:Uncharacterized protein n=1 Tax=Podospora aff. communis PSN243 TaxID=3040156 RepID=A0AAV9GGT9_9PEZI|nr:hypothetical protein QBC34DRAFT_440777 [Podospora aff. communis PSN243]
MEFGDGFPDMLDMDFGMDFPQSLLGFEFLSAEEFGELERGIAEDNLALAKKIIAHRVRLPSIPGKTHSSATAGKRPSASIKPITPAKAKGKAKAASKATPKKTSKKTSKTTPYPTPKTTPSATKSKKRTAREISEEYEPVAKKKKVTPLTRRSGRLSTSNEAKVDEVSAKSPMSPKRRREPTVDASSDSDHARPSKRMKMTTEKPKKRKRQPVSSDSEMSSNDFLPARPRIPPRGKTTRSKNLKASTPRTPAPAEKKAKTEATPNKTAAAPKSSIKAGSNMKVTKFNGAEAKKTATFRKLPPRAKGSSGSNMAPERHVHFDVDNSGDEESATPAPRSRSQKAASNSKATAKALSAQSPSPSPVEGMVYAHGLLFPAPRSSRTPPQPPTLTTSIPPRTTSYSPAMSSNSTPAPDLISRRKSKAPPPKRQSKRQTARRNRNRTASLSSLEVWDEYPSTPTPPLAKQSSRSSAPSPSPSPKPPQFSLPTTHPYKPLWSPTSPPFTSPWPPLRGVPLCAACFRATLSRWHRIRRGFILVLRLLGGDSALSSLRAAVGGFEIALGRYPPGRFARDEAVGGDVLLTLLLRREVRRRMEVNPGLGVFGVGNAMESLTHDVGLGGEGAEVLEGRYKGVLERVGYLEGGGQRQGGERGGGTAEGRLSWWAFDEVLLDYAGRVGRTQEGFEFEFDKLLMEKARGAALAGASTSETVERVVGMAAAVKGGAELDRLVAEMGLNLSVRDVLRVVQGEIEEVVEGFERDGKEEEGVLPCVCDGGVRDGKPWFRPLVEVFDFSEDEARWSSAEDFIHVVEGRGGLLLDPVPALEIVVDGTGGETRVVLVEMGSVLDDIMMEDGEGEMVSPNRQPVGVREHWESGALKGERAV